MSKYIIIITALFITSCSHMGKSTSSSPGVFASNTNLIKESSQAAEELSKLPESYSTKGAPLVIMTSFVNANNFLYSSTLGNTVSEIIGGQLAQKGIPIKEIRLRGNILQKGNHGELILSREFKEVAKEHTADAVVVGTYAEAAESVLISTKMISLDNEQVITAHNFALSKTDDIAALLHGVREEDRYPEIANVDANGDIVDDGNSDDEDAPETLMDSVRAYDNEINKKRMRSKSRGL